MHSKNRFKMYIFVVYELSNNAWSVEHVFDDLLAVLPLHTVYWGENKTRGGL